MEKFTPGWYVMYTKPNHEKKVSEHLEFLSINSYLPTIKTLRKWADRKKYINAPLFPSYLFVQLEDNQGYFNSLEANGSLHYIRTGREIARISDSILNNIKLIVGTEELDIEVTSEHMQVGTKLYIKEGPFTGFCCEVIQHKGKQKLLVRIELLQRNILMDVSVDCLMPAYNI